MIDFKYHIASTVAVFLALGVGILLGGAIVGGDAITKQQEHIVSRLELDFAQLRADRESLQASLARLEGLLEASLEFGEAALKEAARDRLEGKCVALVVCNDGILEDMAWRVAGSFRDAGATIAQIVYMRKRLEPVTGEEAREVAQALGLALSSPEAVGRAAAEAVATCAAKGEVTPAAEHLLELGHVVLDRCTPGEVDAVVVIGGSNDPAAAARLMAVPVVRALRRAGVSVVGVEPSDVRFSYINDYKREGIPTVDCADTPMGRFALVSIVAGDSGHFGLKGTAEILAPPLDFPKP